MKRQRLRDIDGSFAILVTLVIAQIIFLPIVASGKKEVKRGEKVVITEKKSVFNIKRVEVYNAGMDCKQQQMEVCKWCYPEEKKRGCTNKNCSSFLLDDGMESVSLTVPDASDGCYIVEITADSFVKEELLVRGQDQLISAFSPEPRSSREPVESNGTKGTEPPEGGVTEARAIIGVFTGVIIVAIIVIIVIIAVVIPSIKFCCCKKKKQNASDAAVDAGDSEENITPRESISEGEQTTGDSLEMDEILDSADEDHLTVVLIDSGRPGHKHNDDNDDNDEDYSSINCISDEDDCNGKNDNDSNYYSNDDTY